MSAALKPQALRAGALYALIFGALGAHLPFWPLWLSEWGLSAAEVGFYTGCGVFVRIFAGLTLPLLADRLGARRQVVAIISAIGATVFALHPYIEDRTVLLLATLATGLVYPGMIPVTDALTSAAGRAHGFAFGVARAWGSLAFVVANFAVGWLIGSYGADMARVWIVACLFAGIFFALLHPGGGLTPAGTRPGMRDAVLLARKPVFVLFLLAIGFSEASHGVYYAYGSVHWRALGLETGTIGLLWAFPVALETLLMFLLGAAIVQRLGPVGAIAVAGAAGVLRWSLMMTDPLGPLLWAVQALHIVTFAVGYLGAIAFIAEAVEDRLASTAQGLFGAAFGGFLTACAMAVSGLIYPALGGLTYGAAAVMSATGLFAALVLRRYWSGGPV
ncbi:MAG: MFS transporter [Pseudomonadota bacterium]